MSSFAMHPVGVGLALTQNPEEETSLAPAHDVHIAVNPVQAWDLAL